MDEVKLYAAVRYFGTDSHRIHFIETSDIVDFTTRDDFNINSCHFIRKLDAITGDYQKVPAQILAIDDDIENLKHPSTRMRLMNKRYSDAFDECQKAEVGSHENHEPSSVPSDLKKNKDSKKLTIDKELAKKIKAAEIKDNADIMCERMKLSNSNQLNYDESTENMNINALKAQFEEFKSQYQQQLAERDKQIHELKAKVDRKNSEFIKTAPGLINSPKSKISSDHHLGDETNQNKSKVNKNHYKLNENAEGVANSPISQISPDLHSDDNSSELKSQLHTKNSGFNESPQHVIDPSKSPISPNIHLGDNTIKSSQNKSRYKNTPIIKSPTCDKIGKKNQSTKRKLDFEKPSCSWEHPEESFDRHLSKKKRTKNDRHAKEEDSHLLNNEKIEEKMRKNKKSVLKNKNFNESDDSSSDEAIDSEKRKQKKKKREKSYKKQKNSDAEYDSENFESSIHKDFSPWYKTVNGKSVKMFHLKHDISIKYSEWNILKCTDDIQKYLKILATTIWQEYHLVNRAVNLKKSKDRLENRSPRKPLTPQKKAAFRKTYFQKIDMTISIKKLRKVYKKQWKRHLGIFINYLIQKNINQKDKEKFEDTSSDISSSTD